MLIVGAFPPANLQVFGGVVTTCRSLVASSFADKFDLVLLDSTQRSNPPPGLLQRAGFAVSRVVAYIKALVVSRPDAVILFCSVGGSLVEKGGMAALARVLGIRSFIFPQGGRLMDIAASSKIHRFWICRALKGATHFLCQGPAWHRFAVDVVDFPPDRAPVVPNWTATGDLLAIGSARVHRVSSEVNQLLFVGWLEQEKGVFELLDACSKLSATHPFRLVLVGGGNAESEAKSYVRNAALSDVVQFAGWVPQQDLNDLFAESDIFVLPSWAEGLPNSMIEAMATGLAVVVSAVGNVPDVVTDGREALLVPPRSAAELENAIRRLLDDPALRQSLAARGHALVKAEYAVEGAVQILAQVVESAVRSDDRASMAASN